MFALMGAKFVGKNEGFLVKPKVGLLQELRIYLAKDFDLLDLDHQVYLPEKFVVGQFKERGEKYTLVGRDFFYTSLVETLCRYQQGLKEGKLEIVQKLHFTDQQLESIIRSGEAFERARLDITGLVESVQRYFV